jgi:hypothetical protein
MKQVNYSSPKGVMRDNVFTIKKREFIKNIIPTDPFQCEKIEINPGLSSFPWLSGLAPSFEKYSFKRLVIEYKTAQSTFVPGMVMIAPEFNVDDELPSSKQQLLEYAYADRAPVWKDFQVDIKRKYLTNYKEFYVRTSVVPDKKLYDPLFVIYATDAVSTDLEYAGELWLYYEIEFYLPQKLSIETLMKRNFIHIRSTDATNLAPFNINTEKVYGDFPIRWISDHVLQVGAQFTGWLWCQINSTNLGLAEKFYEADKSMEYILTEPASQSHAFAVAGNGTDGNTLGYTMYYHFIKDLPPLGLISFSRLGFYVDEDTELCRYWDMVLTLGSSMDPPPIPSSFSSFF